MNHIYRLVWNAVRQLWQCASENTRTKGKTSTVKAVINTQFTPPLLFYILINLSLMFSLLLF
ncbi:ESPR domain-containing protein [Avibacterium paragallinarum]|uniref:ESPR domain-containing protein n=1 Tax=Avibacterium paragallinarum TaxID=728 RepID=UPI003979D40B